MRHELRAAAVAVGFASAAICALDGRPWGSSFVACADAAAANRPAERPPHAVSAARVTQPRKTKDVRPDYPAAAQKAGIQGVVVIEAIVSTRGCVSQARLVRSIPALDAPAMAAVSSWEFTPTLLDGAPVPVVMTVTVDFALR